MAGGVRVVASGSPGMCKALDSNPSTSGKTNMAVELNSNKWRRTEVLTHRDMVGIRAS
jgi:hypothetical protein